MPLPFDRIADIYDSTRALPEPHMKNIVLAMAKALESSETILDVGVGTGRFARPLQDLGFELIGTDLSRGMMMKAKEKGITDLLAGDAQLLPFRDSSFDSALLVHVLHLFDNWRKALYEIRRVTRKTLVCLAGRLVEGTSIRDAYKDLRSRLGHPIRRFDAGEEGLRQLIAPTNVIHVANYKKEESADDALKEYERMESSVTWDVPEDVHFAIISELTKRFGGQTITGHRTVEVAVWRVNQLDELIREKA